MISLSKTKVTPIPLQRVIHAWWPLAASWLLMGVELPALSAIVARLPNPEINLAAYGGVVFPVALIIESPIIMLLAASTALSKDWSSYRKLFRFMMITSASLTALHILVAFTPLYYRVAEDIIGAPQEIIEPARLGLKIMTPWTWSIAYRRFHQGVLIRFGRSKAVGLGTMVRLAADAVVLATGYGIGTIPGIAVGAGAVAFGVVSEATFIGIISRPVLRGDLKQAAPVDPPLTLRAFLDFYIPLIMTSLLTLLANPIGSAAISRMPKALESLAVWPVVTGLTFLLRSIGIAYNEVVVALLDEVGSSINLRRFSGLLSLATSAFLIVIIATPLSKTWFEDFSALSPELAHMARRGMLFTLPLPALSVLQSWYQGAILYGRQTRGITESVVIYLVSIGSVLALGVIWGKTPGLYIGLVALTISVLTQTLWLMHRSRAILHQVALRDTQH